MENTLDHRLPFHSVEGLMDKIEKIVPMNRLFLDEPMKNHTSFKIGGPTALLIDIAKTEEIVELIALFENEGVKYFVMGNGSNLLVSDDGYTGIVIKLSDFYDHVHIDGHTVVAQSGILLSTLSKKIVKAGLKGFEFASGIPGTVGGAITMNAGAYDGEMKDCVYNIKVLSRDGKIKVLSNEEMNFGYRISDVKRKDYIVLETTFKFESGDSRAIQDKINDFTFLRTSKQPLTLPSAGSMFKRPPGYFAGKLIDDSGLRGLRVGDAQVSEKHCGFVVNRGEATCREVLDLIDVVKKVVMDNYGVMLETEVKYLGG